jgi:hypothetical protein
MTKKLHISSDLLLPANAATSTLLVYGGKGMGKTNFGTVLVEEFFAASIRFAAIDPMGVLWGLRHSADGKGTGIKVLILGGIHGDLPITPESGAIVADLVVDEDVSVIIDISRRADGSMWSISERIRFVTAFAKRFYQRQGEKRRPINLVIDEAARFAPQIVRQGESEVAACMGAIAVLVEEGRNVGIGVTLLTQRSARLNKDVAELADCMISFRIVGPNSMRAVLDWLGEHVEKSRLKELGEKLRSLPRGSALVVSPGWLEFEGIVAMRKRNTFDSSATPEAGKQVRASGAGATLDLDKYRERMATVVEQQKANDPKALKARVAELEKQLAAKHPPASKSVETKTVERSVVKDAQLQRIGVLIDQGESAIEHIAERAKTMAEQLGAFVDKAGAIGLKLEVEIGHLRAAIATTKAPAPIATPARPSADVGRRVYPSKHAARVIDVPSSPTSQGDQSLTGPQRALLETLAWWRSMGHDAPTRAQIAGKAGWKPKGSNLRNRLSELHTAGLVTYPRDSTVALTPAGIAAAPAPREHETLVESIRASLTGPQLVVFDALPRGGAGDLAIQRAELAERLGWEPAGSNLRNRLSELSALELVDYPSKGSVQLQDWVMA